MFIKQHATQGRDATARFQRYFTADVMIPRQIDSVAPTRRNHLAYNVLRSSQSFLDGNWKAAIGL